MAFKNEKLNKICLLLLICLMAGLADLTDAHGARIKDIANIDGFRETNL